MTISTGTWSWLYPPLDFIINRDAVGSVHMCLNIGLNFLFIHEVIWIFWVWQAQHWERELSNNLPDVNIYGYIVPSISIWFIIFLTSGRTSHFVNFYSRCLMLPIPVVFTKFTIEFLTTSEITSKFIKFITSTLLLQDVSLVSSPLTSLMLGHPFFL